jgi:hypothetical protein
MRPLKEQTILVTGATDGLDARSHWTWLGAAPPCCCTGGVARACPTPPVGSARRRAALACASTAPTSRLSRSRGDAGETSVEGLRHGEDLDPVAGGEQQRLGDVLAAEQLVEQLGKVVTADGDPLQNSDRCRAVPQADREQAHPPTSVRRSRHPWSSAWAGGSSRSYLLVRGWAGGCTPTDRRRRWRPSSRRAANSATRHRESENSGQHQSTLAAGGVAAEEGARQDCAGSESRSGTHGSHHDHDHTHV